MPDIERLEAAFARHGRATESLVPTDLGCAECRGVLCVAEVGKGGLLIFRCRVGHTFSLDSLLEAKEEQLEEALWTTLEVFEELVQLYGEAARRGKTRGERTRSAELERRRARAQNHRRALKRLIESDGPSPEPVAARRPRRA